MTMPGINTVTYELHMAVDAPPEAVAWFEGKDEADLAELAVGIYLEKEFPHRHDLAGKVEAAITAAGGQVAWLKWITVTRTGPPMLEPLP